MGERIATCQHRLYEGLHINAVGALPLFNAWVEGGQHV